MHIFFFKKRRSLQKILFVHTHFSLFSIHEGLNYSRSRSFFVKNSSVVQEIFRSLRKKLFMHGNDAQAYMHANIF